MIQSVYYVVVYTSQGVPASVYRHVFFNAATANRFAEQSLFPEMKELYNTTSFDGYYVHQFSISRSPKYDLPF